MITRMKIIIIVILTAIGLVFSAGCSPHPNLVGKWKWAATDCLRGYAFPDTLEFLNDGTYVGELPFLNGGKYEVVDNGRVRLDTTAGSRIYEYAFDADALTLTSDALCVYRYKRTK